jgi:hypothetical protein
VICVVFQLWKFLAVVYAAETGVFTDGAETLCEDSELLTREVVLLDSLADDFFGDAVGVDIRWRGIAISW